MQTATHHDALSRFGYALSDPTRAEILLILRDGPGYPSDLADKIGVSRQILSNHLACLRGCGLVVAQPEGRRSRYELADPRIAHALDDLVGLVLAVDPACCPASETHACADERPTRDAARDTATPDPATGRRDDHLQRDRGSRRVGGGHARLVVGV